MRVSHGLCETRTKLPSLCVNHDLACGLPSYLNSMGLHELKFTI